MRLSASEKYEIIQEVTMSEIGVKQTLEKLWDCKKYFLQMVSEIP